MGTFGATTGGEYVKVSSYNEEHIIYIYMYTCIVYCCYMLYIYIHSVYVLNDILYVRHNILFVYYIYIHTICSFSMLYTLFTVYR